MLTISNFLSLSRIILAPLTIKLILSGGSSIRWAFLCFSIASITDFFDGYYARRFHTKTALGAFLDPFADKVLVLGAFAAFYWIDLIKLWMVICIALRDIVVTLLRSFMAKRGHAMVTTWSAKWKTTLQFFTIIALFGYLMLQTNSTSKVLHHILLFCVNYSLITILMYIVVGFTIWTGIDYLIQNTIRKPL